MVSLILFFAASILWQEDFAETTSGIHQLYDYHVEIAYEAGSITLRANPQFEGFASAWMYVDEEIALHDDDALVIRIRGDENTVRIRYFFRKQKCTSYYAGENTISVEDEWKDVVIPLKNAFLFSGTEFPAALTPDTNPVLYIFIENAMSGKFAVEINQISIIRHSTQAEER